MERTEPAAGTDQKDQAAELKAKAEAMQAQADELKAKAEEMQARAAELQAQADALKAKTEAIKARIAEQVRVDSQQRAALTPEESIIELDDDLRYGRMELGAILAEMAAEEGYGDIKSLTTASGMVFLYSDTCITAEDAAAKGLVEEAKIMLARAIREDSLAKVKLTPAGEIYAMAPDTDPAILDALLKGMQTESRFSDIKTVTAANGDVYFHSDKYLVSNYAATLLMAMAGDHYSTIAATVREDSNIYPRTTSIAIFRDQEVYGVPSGEVETIVAELLRKSEYGDIKKIVHPVTGSVHLYSERYITADRAWAMMDWEEVGRANNP